MLKLLIVDDEPGIREGLRKIINWEKHEFYICGEAENGREGLGMALEMSPDLIILDVKMPNMDGLEMLEELRKRNMQCKAIILTAYSDFKYAQEAIELGVDSYVLKPIDEDELLKKVCKIRDEILNMKKVRIAQDVSISLSRDKILENLVLGEGGIKQVEKGNITLGFHFPWKSYQVLILVLEKTDSDLPVLKRNIRRSIEKYISENNYGMVLNIENNICILLKDISFETHSKIIKELQKKVLRSHGIYVTILVGRKVSNLSNVPVSYRHARNLLKNQFIHGHKRIIATRGKQSTDSKEPDINSYFENLCDSILFNNMSRINNVLEEIRRRFVKTNCSEEVIKMNYTNLYVSISDKLMRDNEPEKNNAIRGQVLSEIHKKSNLHELHGYIKYILLSISDELAKSKYTEPIYKILNYIEINYYKDLKLENLSERFHYHSAYLGKLFKKSTGQYFNTYLDLVRIEKAKQFLKEGYKVYQVAEKVGFHDIDYFSAKFKKYVGISPSSYKVNA